MADLKIKNVQARNWASLGSFDVDFPESGLVIVQGVNTASGGAMQSIGSGKTLFGEAISYTLFGVSSSRGYTSMKEFSKDEKGDTYVRVEALLRGKKLLVESGYKCEEMSPTGAALRFCYDGKEIERGRIEQTREELNRLLGVSQTLASWTVFADGDAMKFTKLSQNDAVELVLAALKQPPWGEYHEKSKKVLNSYKQVVFKEETNHQNALNRVSESEADAKSAATELDSARETYRRLKTQTKQGIQEQKDKIQRWVTALERNQASMAEITKKLKVIEEEKAKAHHRLEIKLNDANEKLRKATIKTRSLWESKTPCTEKHANTKTAYENYSRAKVCPTCQRPMGEKPDPARVAELKAEYEAAVVSLNETNARIKESQVGEDTLRKEAQAIQRQIADLRAAEDTRALSDNYAELEDGIQSINDEIRKCETQITALEREVSDEPVKMAEATHAERVRLLTLAKGKLEEVTKSLLEAKSTLKVLEYWNHAYSPTGIPNMVLRQAIDPLNHEAKRLSSMMTGGTIEVKFNTARELASGESKSQLNIKVNNKLGSKNFKGSSKGEGGITNLILAETLSEVGQVSRRVGFRWYDEVLPNQDPRVCKSVYSYLKDVASKLGIVIFMVDHNPAAANYADYLLVVEKTGTEKNISGKVYWR